jgi:hypothetical protein
MAAFRHVAEFFVSEPVPPSARGVEHCPLTHGEVHAMLIEPASVVNTGDAGGSLTATPDHGSARPG